MTLKTTPPPAATTAPADDVAAAVPARVPVILTRGARYRFRGLVIQRGDVVDVTPRDRNHLVATGWFRDYREEPADAPMPTGEPAPPPAPPPSADAPVRRPRAEVDLIERPEPEPARVRGRGRGSELLNARAAAQRGVPV